MKSMKLGGGGRFAKGKAKLMRQGKSATSAAAIMASAGRKKYGAKKMNSMAKAGHKRAFHAHVKAHRGKGPHGS